VSPGIAGRDDGTLVAVAREAPTRLLPPAANDAETLLVDLLYDPLYRLDPTLRPQPALAAGLPVASEGGRTWTITLAGPALFFQDGRRLTANDVAFSLRLARSPACTLGRDLCDVVASYLDAIAVEAADRLTITLTTPFSPFLAEALGRLPILSEAAVTQGTGEIVEAAADLDPTDPDEQVARIARQTNADECLVASPPFGCRLADHISELEVTLAAAGLAPPPRSAWTDPTGTFDAEAYASTLLDRVAALGLLLTGSDIDRMAAALPLLDPAERPLGSGPFRLVDGGARGPLTLAANPYHVGGRPSIERIELQVEPDPAAAVTQLLTGQVDWLLRVDEAQRSSLSDAQGVVLGRRPMPLERVIVFNVRKGRVYHDAATRSAFARCLDREALAMAVTDGDAIVATTPVSQDSWAMEAAPSPPRDPQKARELLATAGWAPGGDGIMVRGGQRLSSEIAVRASRSDLVAFAGAASAQLRECGIELIVRELDLTGDLLLTQLQWPNEFDTVLVARPLGVDPHHDLEAYASEHATSQRNPADSNPGGYASDAVDRLVAEGSASLDEATRAAAYREVQDVLARDVPAWPIWYDAGWSALSDRVRSGDAPVDPTRPRYAWDLAEWSLAPLG
jgi:ABC-type transport system substrate-binding protein